jgi:stage II sporulation protein D
MSFTNARKLDRKSGVRPGERGAPVQLDEGCWELKNSELTTAGDRRRGDDDAGHGMLPRNWTGAPRSPERTWAENDGRSPSIVLCQNKTRPLLRTRALISALLFFPPLAWAQTTAQAALSSALRNSPAVGVVLDLKSGRRVAVFGPAEAESLRSTPGSILKPLFLAGALLHQQVQPQSTVFCRRDLQISADRRDWNLACTHPQTDISFDAQEALAYSCNRYFANLADRISLAQTTAILEYYGLAVAKTPETREEKQLLVLGVAGISVSPAQMASAYRKLALELDDKRLEAVREGLYNSVRYGMAHNAFVPGMEVAGKTGTASDTMQGSSHGWFAGVGSFNQKQVVTVIYLPRGNGADAARLAQQFFLATRPAPESARALTVEVWASRSVTHLTATSLDNTSKPVIVDWLQNRQPLELSGNYRLQAADTPDLVAAGKWTVTRQPHGLRVLLTLPSESYVIAALSGEAAPDEPMASLKAMAISMRTFALVNANRHQTEGFGLCDSTHCQALRLGKPRPEVEQAVRETAGETLWSGGQRAHIYYTQHCGGVSEAASTVWPEERAGYLAGQRTDSYCVRRSAAQWQSRIPLRQLDEIFRAQGWHTPSPITDIRIAQRDATGRAELLQLTGHGGPAQLSASSFRFAVDRALGWNQMRSDWYSLTLSGADLEIRGKGYGHGVGLCQAGAFEMATEGRSEKEILSFYFPGTVPGMTPAGDGWKKVAGTGWTLLTTELTTGPADGLLSEGNAAWARAQSLLGRSPQAPTVQELPTTELFRQTTGEPGWMLASTRGSHIFLQPATVRHSNGGAETLLLHEFLHVLVEQEAGASAPLWLREGLVESLAAPGKRTWEPVDLPAAEVDAALAHPESATASRRAHEAAARMAALLRARYGMPAVLEFLRNGVPSEAVKSLGS